MKLARYCECTGCGACSDACSKKAIEMKLDKNGFLHPFLNHSLCVDCGLCAKSCPILHLDSIGMHSPEELKNYSAWSNDDDVCRHSSSGGIFSQIAIDFLKKGNSKVYGARYNNDNTCTHIGIERLEDLPLLQGTKYIQSNASGIYSDVRDTLKSGKKVFFCGTPCQVAGLYAFLRGKYLENLFTADLICHGVPSGYLLDIVCKAQGYSHIVSWRDKNDGWAKVNNGHLVRASQVKSYESNTGEIIRSHGKEFNCGGKCYRESCTICRFASPSRIGDISLGDQWGLYDSFPERYSLGNSLVLTNSVKGEMLIHRDSITAHEHPNCTLTCWTIFCTGVGKGFSFSKWMWLIRRLPVRLAVSVLAAEWRWNLIMLPFAIYFRYKNKQHVQKTLRAVIEGKKMLGWN